MADKKYAAITENTCILYEHEIPVLEISLPELVSYSIGKPWSMEYIYWKNIESLQSETTGLVFKDDFVTSELKWKCCDNYLELELSFENCSNKELTDFCGQITIPINKAGKQKVTIPHVIYNDNPSADPERVVPHIGTKVNDGIIVEEHRLPIPAVNVEWKEDGKFPFFTLCSIPEVTTGFDKDYWSIGVVQKEEGKCITALTGPLMFQGMKDVVYGGRCTPLPYFEGYKTLKPGEKIKRTYRLDWGLAEGEGKGFRSIAVMGYDTFKPEAQSKEEYASMIDYKLRVVDSRYYKEGNVSGYKTFGSANSFKNISGRPEYFLYGWTGQTIKIAWCECLRGLTSEETFRFKRGMEVVDFFMKEGMSSVKGLWYGYYMIDDKEWRGSWNNKMEPISSRILGESMSDVLDLMLLLKKYSKEVPKHWEDGLKMTCEFLMDEKKQTSDGIYPFAWTLEGEVNSHTLNASGMPCVLTLVKAYEYFREDSYLEYAKMKYDRYAYLHMDTFDIPFARATMDAKCEDKEAGIYFFLAAANIYRVTEEEKYKTWASISADWLLTFVFFWETGFYPKSQCDQNNFSTVGWPGVSVQNHHLDVFFPSYELYAFGKAIKEERYEVMGQNVRNAMTNGVCKEQGEWGFDVIGEQGEHYYHTNYYQSRYPGVLGHLKEWRGGMQVWNPSWITAQVLQNNLMFYYDSERKTRGMDDESR